MFATLNREATPVLPATSVSMLAEPRRSCRHALMKKSRPSTKTTGVDNSHMNSLA